MKWGIIGGGMLGLTLARELARAGEQVVVHESAPECGGLASAWRIGEVEWDKHYHITLQSDMATRGVLAEIGLDQEMQWVKARNGIFTGGQLHPFSSNGDVLRFPPLGLIDRLRLGAAIFYARRIRNWQPLEQVPASDWLTRLSGGPAFEKVWRPLLREKLGDPACDEAPASFMWASIGRSPSRTKHAMAGYLPGGYGRMLARYAEFLREQDVEIRLNSRAREVQTRRNGLSVQFGDGTASCYDQVVFTTPMPLAAAVCSLLSAAEKSALRQVRYHGVVCCSLLLQQPLGEYCVTHIADGDAPFASLIDMSALVDRQQLGGRALVYLPKYVPSGDDAFDTSDEEWRQMAIQTLSLVYPDFDPNQLEAFQVSRARYVFASPVLGYSKRLPSVQTSVPGLHILNSAQIVNNTLNVNEAVELAQRGARDLLAVARPGSSPNVQQKAAQ